MSTVPPFVKHTYIVQFILNILASFWIILLNMYDPRCNFAHGTALRAIQCNSLKWQTPLNLSRFLNFMELYSSKIIYHVEIYWNNSKLHVTYIASYTRTFTYILHLFTYRLLPVIDPFDFLELYNITHAIVNHKQLSATCNAFKVNK